MKRVARAVPVLMYHHVSTSPGMITVTPEHFAEQIACIAQLGYRTLSARQFADYLAGAPVPPKSVVITFDDGYLDNWVHAHPVLQRHGFSAMCFLVSAWPGEGAPRPNAAGGDITALPRLLGHEEGESAIEQGRADDVILRWSEIEAMRTAGTFEFHSHTHTHARWDRLTQDRDEKRERLRDDLAKARATLRQRLGDVSDHLCWPQGYYDDDYREIALAAGFRHFYTCDRGTNPVQRQPVPTEVGQSIRRLEVRDRPANWLASRLWVHSRPAVSRAYLAIKR
ncbi:polysaccharide deacetylase family protein [Paraburkholderia diazotrophica]|uniref:Peptidoglycan/xylan/chitin deacetylase, PgdA/CDA1 family n=1 Tax=Paraburkholderia diazotrophica TaxID=667676 RepID=A0A1H7DSV8_9BURK|nr:polysaccharide deacetylase family protein [Paraburkholderia diazotrophica]SEK03937.1 Peptidoglycan/xylan/chitin deacetylase, PgdA/CDA1 family [Paraburkholderia diazotrophica]